MGLILSTVLLAGIESPRDLLKPESLLAGLNEARGQVMLCFIRRGMTTDEVRAILGDPDGVFGYGNDQEDCYFALGFSIFSRLRFGVRHGSVFRARVFPKRYLPFVLIQGFGN